MERQPDITLVSVAGRTFEDTIDGYFPLQTSLAQMMERNGFATALLKIGFAPVIDVPGLPPAAPVPLNIRAGRAGMIEDMELLVTRDGRAVSGHAAWYWFGDRTRHADTTFDPMTRLAEPALVQGIGFARGTYATRNFGNLAATTTQTGTGLALLTSRAPGATAFAKGLAQLGWDAGQVLFPPATTGVIARSETGAGSAPHLVPVDARQPLLFPDPAPGEAWLLIRSDISIPGTAPYARDPKSRRL